MPPSPAYLLSAYRLTDGDDNLNDTAPLPTYSSINMVAVSDEGKWGLLHYFI